MYQCVSAFLFVQISLNMQLEMHIASKIANSISTCVFVILSTVDLFNGGDVEFFISFVS